MNRPMFAGGREFPGYVRAIAFFGGAATLALSIYYSAKGFGVAVPDMAWVGWVTGLIITAIEIVWNKAGRGNLTIGITGLSAYAYGIVSNMMGIMAIRGVSDPFENTLALILIGFFSFLIEVGAEPLMIIGATGHSDSDPISEMIGNIVDIASRPFSGRSRMPSPPHSMGGNGHEPQFIETRMGRRIPIPPKR